MNADRGTLMWGVASPATTVPGSAVRRDGAIVGRVTAGGWSPHFGHGVGSARMLAPGDLAGVAVTLDAVDDPATLVGLPFYDAERRLPRGLP